MVSINMNIYFICHMAVFLSVNITSTMVNGRKVKALSQYVPDEQLQMLATQVCMDLDPYIEQPSNTSCIRNFWKNSHKVSSDSSAVKIKCLRAEHVVVEVPISKHWQIVLLAADKYEVYDYITYGLLEPGRKYENIYRSNDVKYTIWSAVLSDKGVPYKWTKILELPVYDEIPPVHRDYDVTVTFVGNYSDSDAYISGTFSWNSTGENDLCFDIVNICHKADILQKFIWPSTHPSITIDELPLDDKCRVKVKGFYGTTEFHYRTPSCADHEECIWGNTKPEYPPEMSVHATEGAHGMWNVHVDWTRPKLLPQRYNITVRTDDNQTTVSVPGNASEVVITDIVGEGIYNVSIYAIIGNHSAHTSRRAIFPGVAAWVWAGAAAGAWCALAAAATLAAALRCRRRTAANQHYFLEVEEKCGKEDLEGAAESVAEDQWEVRSERVLLHELIGEGAFGLVRRATLAPHGIQVAVKMLKDFPTQDEIRSFRAEMELMKSVGAHPHVVSLLGCCSARRPFIVAEYCSRGDLLTYLRCSWDVMVSKRNAKYYNNNTDSTDYRNDLFKFKLQKETKLVINKLYDLQGICDLELTPLDLLSFCRQIAMGMEFLSSNRVVHRDLAARNVLVTGDRTLKIADFGLSRDVYEENQYKQKGNGKMPVKWMALESLTRRIYTTQSDVWSFGVVIWEIVTVGGSPYPDVPVARLVRLLRAGYRMPRPINCSKQLYELMRCCWRAHPRERPTFSELHAQLDELLHAASAHHYLALELDHEHEHEPQHSAPHRYIHMLIRGKNPWSRGASYERPVTTTCNHYTSLPGTANKIPS